MSAVYNMPSPDYPPPDSGQNYNPDIVAATNIALKAQIDLLEQLLEEAGEDGEIRKSS
jgi:hypothetical protein